MPASKKASRRRILPFQCAFCDRTFATQGDAAAHESAVHKKALRMLQRAVRVRALRDMVRDK